MRSSSPRSRAARSTFVVSFVVSVLAVLAFTSRADADDFLKSSPGELAASHAALDTKDQCSTCHEPDNSISANKCLACHDHGDLKQRIASGQGFHVSVKVKGVECKLCHQEHRGRRFDLMGWRAIGGEAAFDHKLAGWELVGKHAKMKCTQCHKSVDKQGLRTYLNTDRTCGSCHSKDQPHGAIRPAMMKCDRCHSESLWKPQKAKLDFNHNDAGQAAMPLEGSHADVACSKCHAKAAFKLAAFTGTGDCVQCHASPHDGQLFGTKKCQTCHSAALKSLREVRFDHKKDAGYALIGKHAQLACATCHTKALAKVKPAPGCENCHAKDNKHGTRFAKLPACTTCHTQKAWKGPITFNHSANTGFALTAKHTTVKCRDCHRGKSPSDFEKFEIKNGCMSCHRHKVAHGGQYKNNECLTCHQEGGTKTMRKDALEVYHGETSKFPLRNGHANVKCTLCHVNDVYEGTPRECGVSCHEDSLHKGSLGQECSRCHEPGKWPAVRFDHTADTKWPLKGKHVAVSDCAACHPSRAYQGTPTTCGSAGCHQKDDVHQGKLGTQCERCHGEDKSLRFQHNRDATFKIDGKHTPLLCAACHKSVTFKPVRSDCVGCHAEPAIHKGRYGTACERCHSSRSFTDISAQHDVGDFSLTGAHDQLACAKCHPSGEKLRGSGNLCITCHRKDDVHKNTLSPRCGDCHGQRSFTPARFDHASTSCNLKGLHVTLPCADCHKSGNYTAVSPLCVSCHRPDALRVRQPDHRGLIDCGNCHNPSSWIPATAGGQQTICR
ncbi:MAG: hypothetical protein NT062_04910 [Proteobacteria bacterium]|nr:hypothetical protein [Pseudomonadota bacterium]